jgi:hypothetical protein
MGWIQFSQVRKVPVPWFQGCSKSIEHAMEIHP